VQNRDREGLRRRGYTKGEYEGRGKEEIKGIGGKSKKENVVSIDALFTNSSAH
jgi:hypothetical protein